MTSTRRITAVQRRLRAASMVDARNADGSAPPERRRIKTAHPSDWRDHQLSVSLSGRVLDLQQAREFLAPVTSMWVVEAAGKTAATSMGRSTA